MSCLPPWVHRPQDATQPSLQRVGGIDQKEGAPRSGLPSLPSTHPKCSTAFACCADAPSTPAPPPPLGGRPRSSSRCRPSPRPGTRPTTLYTSCAQSRCWRWMTLWSAWCRWAGIQVWPSSSVSHQGIPLRQQRLGLGGPALLPPLLCLPPSAALHARRVRNARRRSQVAFAAMVCPPGNSVPQSHCLSDQKWRTRSAMTCRLLTPQAS